MRSNLHNKQRTQSKVFYKVIKMMKTVRKVQPKHCWEKYETISTKEKEINNLNIEMIK